MANLTTPVSIEPRVGWSPDRIRRLRRWRAVMIAGGLSLTISFFVPRSISTFMIFPFLGFLSKPATPIVPLDMLVTEVGKSPASVGFLLHCVPSYLLPYVFGLWCLVIGVGSFDFRLRIQRSMGSSLLVLFGIFGLIGLTGEFYDLYLGRWRSNNLVEWLMHIAFLVMFGVVLARCFRRRRGGALSARFWCSLGYVLAFNFHLFQKPLLGSRMSLIGASCVLLATFAEVHVRCRMGLLRTLWKLLSCRVQLPDLEGPQCFECGYLLFGLTSHRCPECGLPFDAAEHGLGSTARAISAG